MWMALKEPGRWFVRSISRNSEMPSLLRNPLPFQLLSAKPHQSKHLSGSRLVSFSAGAS